MKLKIVLFLCCLFAAMAAYAQNNARMLTGVNAQTGVSYTFVPADTTRAVTFNNASPIAVTLPNGATQGFGAGTMLTVINLGAGTVTITCTSCTVSGAGSLVLSQNQGTDIYGGAGNPAVNYVALPVAVGGAIGGTIAVNQVATGSAPNTVTGSPNFSWNTPVIGALNINSPSASCPSPVSCTVLSFTNSNATNPLYFVKAADGSFTLQNDASGIPSHGFFGWTGDGTGQFSAGNNGPQVQLHTNITTDTGWTFPAGTVAFHMGDSGIGTAQFALNTPGTALPAKVWDTGTGCDSLYAASSSTIKITACPPSVGNAAVLSAVQCGTVAANAACANTVTNTAHCISGIATLSAGTSTITGISPPFTSSSSWFIVTNDITTTTNSSKGVPASGTTATFTGTGTDNIQFIACGG